MGDLPAYLLSARRLDMRPLQARTSYGSLNLDDADQLLDEGSLGGGVGWGALSSEYFIWRE